MTAITFTTLRDYASTYRLHAYYPACRHHAVLEPARAARRAGWDAPLETIRRALTCSQCGGWGAHITISHDGRPGDV